MLRFLATVLTLVVALAACSTGTPAPTPVGATPPPGSTLPPGAPTPPISLIPDQPLEDAFPDDIGGVPLEVESAVGRSILGLFTGSTEADLNEVLAPLGKTINDASAAFAFHFVPNPSDPADIKGVSILALRVSGVAGADLVNRFAQLVAESQAEEGEPPPTIAPATIAGKNVTAVTPADGDVEQAAYLYGVGDAVFVVGGTPELVEETLSKLP